MKGHKKQGISKFMPVEWFPIPISTAHNASAKPDIDLSPLDFPFKLLQTGFGFLLCCFFVVV
jgi:hypothetical protein